MTLAWGDGTRSRPSPPTASVPAHPVATAGTIVFQHAYAAPADGASFSKHVGVLSSLTGRELFGGDLVIIPRYRVTQQPIEFSPLNHCDSVAEEYTGHRFLHSTAERSTCEPLALICVSAVREQVCSRLA